MPKPAVHDWVLVPNGDPRMARVKARAQKRIRELLAALRSNDSRIRCYGKAAFERVDKSGYKHMWVRLDSEVEGVLLGLIDDDTQNKTRVQTGELVRVQLADIEDWIIDRGGRKQVGNFSLPVLNEIERENAKVAKRERSVEPPPSGRE